MTSGTLSGVDLDHFSGRKRNKEMSVKHLYSQKWFCIHSFWPTANLKRVL